MGNLDRREAQLDRRDARIAAHTQARLDANHGALGPAAVALVAKRAQDTTGEQGSGSGEEPTGEELCANIQPSTPVVILQEKLVSAKATALVLEAVDLPIEEQGKCTSAVCFCLTKLIDIATDQDDDGEVNNSNDYESDANNPASPWTNAKCCRKVDGKSVHQGPGSIFGEYCTGTGACLRIEADGSHSCEINPGLFPTEQICNGEVSHGVWCQGHSCETAAPTSAPTMAPTAAPTAAPTSAPASPLPGTTPSTGVVVGNDPIIKMNGSVYKFHLKPGVRTPLLSWSQHQGKKDQEQFIKYELLGVTFKPRTLKVKEDSAGFMSILEDAQWFSQLTLMANAKVVLNVTRGIGGFGGMGIQVDGKHKLYDADKWINKFVGHPRDGLELPITLGRLKKHVGNKFAQALVIDAPELRFSIETMPALKFNTEEDKVAFGHLNLKFEGDALPVSSRGLLAQLAGTRALTKHNKNKFDLIVRKLGQDRTDMAAAPVDTSAKVDWA